MSSFLVLVVGLEPTRCHQHRILSPTRLPFHHTSIILLHQFRRMADRLPSAERSERHDNREYSTTPARIAYLIYHKIVEISTILQHF